MLAPIGYYFEPEIYFHIMNEPRMAMIATAPCDACTYNLCYALRMGALSGGTP